jgi:hypothetical protein
MQSNSDKLHRPARLRHFIQPAIVKLYRFSGIVTLGAIFIGLLAFITVAVFYYFNRTWVRPVILSPEHAKVIEASTTLNEAKLRESELASERQLAKAELANLERTITTNQAFEEATRPLLAAGVTSAETALLRREVDRAALERQAAADRKAALATRIDELDGRVGEQDKMVARLAASPYIRATEERRVVGFVPSQNLTNVQPGVVLYGCSWGLIRCHKVGKVVSILDGEVQDVHPHDDSIQRGVMVEVQLNEAQWAEEQVLFAGSKPFWWL